MSYLQILIIVSGNRRVPDLKYFHWWGTHSASLKLAVWWHPSSGSSSSGTELPLVVESFGLLNNIFSFPSILDTGYPIFNLHLANVLFDVVFPSILESFF